MLFFYSHRLRALCLDICSYNTLFDVLEHNDNSACIPAYVLYGFQLKPSDPFDSLSVLHSILVSTLISPSGIRWRSMSEVVVSTVLCHSFSAGFLKACTLAAHGDESSYCASGSRRP